MANGDLSCVGARHLLSGGDEWADVDPVRRVVRLLHDRYGSSLTILSGREFGADLLACDVANELVRRDPMVRLTVHDARPTQHDFAGVTGVRCYHGRRDDGACPVALRRRNHEMLTEGRPDAVWVFHEDLRRSRTTRDLVDRSVKAGLPVFLNGVFYDQLPATQDRLF